MSEVVTLPAPDITVTPVLTPAQEKFERERRAFFRLLPELLRTHRGQYAAIHDEQVVGIGPNQIELALQQYKRFGYVPIYVGLISDEPRVSRIPYRRELRGSYAP
jgi:hypothetical protein